MISLLAFASFVLLVAVWLVAPASRTEQRAAAEDGDRRPALPAVSGPAASFDA